MTVDDIREMISESRSEHIQYVPGSDKQKIVSAYQRSRVNDAELLLSLLKVIYGQNGKSADKLFLELMTYKNPSIKSWSENEFKGSANTVMMSQAVNDLYNFSESEESQTFLKSLDVNCYSKLYRVYTYTSGIAATHCILLNAKCFLFLDSTKVNYIKYMFGCTFIQDLPKPIPTDDVDLINCCAYIPSMLPEKECITVEELTKIAPKVYIPLTLPRAKSYEVQKSASTYLITIIFTGTKKFLDDNMSYLQNDISRIINHDSHFKDPVNKYKLKAINFDDKLGRIIIGVTHL